ncbi:HEAT repeat domain-containing protein [Sinomicrobium weinanense]|uniref:HEAT repeat domain-containing protein n=1 Tax=Sinomicrobium weinanense TaxID=2842200 RepID=A0A926JWH3_9FLAO|nr:HEAT repeat domain-containing protein [Sinomicrobium weinanense]MBC9798614.1 HEAT repeat domain-containing protein [Sinomicrobium weinanense]MBU3124481.1 HEAT repeat domain-containing protein [Sinomicrobium weinanense]
MKNKHVIDLLPDYLDHLLDAKQHAEVRQHLEVCKECTEHLKELELLLSAFRKEKMVRPGTTLKTRFDHMLEEEIKRNNKPVYPLNTRWLLPVLKIAAGIVILIGSFALGAYYQNIKSGNTIARLKETGQQYKQTAMLSLIESESASKRIQGIGYIEEFPDPDKKITTALIKRMESDPNTNVRLAAVHALEKFARSEAVKNAFVKALENETDPGVQIAVIHALVRIQEKKAVEPMQRILKQESTPPYVKKQIKALIPAIT